MPTRALPLLPLRRSAAKPGAADAGATTPAPSTGSSSGGGGDGGGSPAAEGAAYTEHATPLTELARRLELPYPLEAEADPATLQGLPTGVAAGRLARHGPNALTPPKGKSELRRFVEKFLDPFMLLLELAAVLSLALYLARPREQRSSLYVAVVLFAIILLTSLLAYYQEGQSARVMGAFQSMMSAEAMVIRDGLPQKIPTTDVTVGDLVKLASGGRVPADVRVLASDGLKVDNSSFTGESLPVELSTEATDAAHALHSHNMAFSSALVVEGEGLGVVVRVGDKTMIGSIASLATATKEEKSTLEVEVLQFVRFISFLAIATGVLFYAIAVGRGGDPLQMFIACFVVIVIANVPEGLPATVTSCLTISARRLAARQVFVKRLDVVETLGSTTVIASDKTGTLTQNRMTVSHLWVDGALKLGHYMQREGAWRNEGKDRDSFLELLYAAGLCNMAKFEEEAVPVRLQGVNLLPGPAATARGDRAMSLLSVSNSSTYLRSRRVLTDFGGVATQDSRRMTMEAAAQARLRRLSNGGVVTTGPPPPPSVAHRESSILKADFFEEPASFRPGERHTTTASKDRHEATESETTASRRPPSTPPPSLATEATPAGCSCLALGPGRHVCGGDEGAQTHVPGQHPQPHMGTRAMRLRSTLSGSGSEEAEGGAGGDKGKGKTEEAGQGALEFPAIRRSLSNVLPPAIVPTIGTGPGPRALTVGRLSEVTGGGVPGASRHHVTISDVTLASSLQSAALGAAGTRGSLPLSMPGGPRRSSAGALSAASSLTTTLTMGRGVWGQAAAAAARATLMVPTCKVVGNPSDVAIFNYVHGLADTERLRVERPLVYMIPFNSRVKWMLTVHSFHAAAPAAGGRGLSGGYLLYMKGAPEIILGKCDAILIKGRPRPLNDIYKRAYKDAYKEVAAQGERVLAVALRFLDPREWAPGTLTKADFKRREAELPTEGGLCFVGLVSLVDPPKPRVAEAVQKCKVAGVRVAMVTGDHPLTAEAIARKVNIIHDFATREEIARGSVAEAPALAEAADPKAVPDEQVGAAVVDCRTLGDFTQDQWDALLRKPELVFARASPQDKLAIVQQLRRAGEVVAVTGDGVNDAPALKNADIGLAMGIQGSEVAKNAANVILMDDDFSSIVKGIEEGRVLFDNLTKTIAYTLAHALPELVAVVINLIFNLPYGLTSLMILSIDMLTEIGPAVSFAWEPAEANVMERPPRNRNTDRLVRPALLAYAYLQAGVIETVFCLAAYFFVLLNNGLGFGDLMHPERVSPKLATMAATAYYVTLILSQALHLLAVKTRAVSVWDHGPFSSNIMMVYGVLVALGIMLFIVYVPGVDTAFGTYARLSALYFLPSLASGAFLVIWGETRKATLRKMYAREQVWGEVEGSWFYKCFAW